MNRHEMIQALINSDNGVTEEQAKGVLDKAEIYALKHKEITYICRDIGCFYLVKHSYLTMSDDIIVTVIPKTFVSTPN